MEAQAEAGKDELSLRYPDAIPRIVRDEKIPVEVRVVDQGRDVRRSRDADRNFDHAAELLPWVRVEHFAFHILGCMARLLPLEWERVYGHPIYDLETFVDRGRFPGTCYRAANWQYLGLTVVLGKD